MHQQGNPPASSLIPLWGRWMWPLLVLSCGPPVVQALRCPSLCRCPDPTSLDCSHSHLSSLSSLMPPPQSSSFSSTPQPIIVNLSSNSLTSLDDLQQRLPVAQTTLDLSFNRISTVPLNAFGGELFADLRALNLSGNLLADLGFTLPSSLQVLELGRNRLRRLCPPGRLKGLPQLRVLSLEYNALETLACNIGGEEQEEEKKEEEEKLPKEKKKQRSKVGSCPFPPLPQIVEVWLRGNRLERLERGWLDCFRNAQVLSLADNALQSLPADVFEGFHHLRYLDLSGNRLTFVPEGMFLQMTGLKFLSLARNRLTRVPAALPMLEWLDLSHNAIASIPESQKADLYPQEVFLIGGNPFHCVCDLLWLKELYDTREYLLKFIDVDRKKFVPACASPGHVQGDSWDVLGDQAFGCKGNEDTTLKKPAAKAGGSGEEKSNVVRLEELAVKVRDVGTTHIRLGWDSLPLTGGKKPVENRETRKVFLSCRPFGRKQEKKTAIVQLTLGSHRFRGLQPSTAYVVCAALTDPSSSSSSSSGEEVHLGGQALGRGDCIEVVTKEDEQAKLWDVYTRVGVVIVVSILLAIKCLYTSSQRKDVAARLKED